MIAAAATHGDVTICGCIPTHMEALTAKLLEMGARVEGSATIPSASAQSAITEPLRLKRRFIRVSRPTYSSR